MAVIYLFMTKYIIKEEVFAVSANANVNNQL
jgi:hypothetical protein